MNFINKYGKGILICLLIAIPSWIIGKMFPVIGGAVIAILAGMIIAMFWNDKGKAEAGIKWTSKIVLQTAVVLLGFGMNLGVIFETGKQSLPIIVCTITTSLVLAWVMKKVLKVPSIHRFLSVLVHLYVVVLPLRQQPLLLMRMMMRLPNPLRLFSF